MTKLQLLNVKLKIFEPVDSLKTWEIDATLPKGTNAQRLIDNYLMSCEATVVQFDWKGRQHLGWVWPTAVRTHRGGRVTFEATGTGPLWVQA